ncbi:MAG: hypothetical protein KBA61_08135 [Spirochaetes bacterium]|nr:hypothetical protein [Spirochaetota bacterium]
MEINKQTAEKIWVNFKGYIDTVSKIESNGMKVFVNNMVLLAALDILVPLAPEKAAEIAEYCKYIRDHYEDLESDGISEFQAMMAKRQ